MAPRGYTLRRRAATAAATRSRILDAAIDLYRDRGIDGTTITSVASAADVARGTVINHFGSTEALLGEALDHLLARLEVPDERILEGVVGLEGRIRAFVDAMIDFQERSTPWWETFASEMQRPALQQREMEYWAAFERLLARALGPGLAADPRAGAAILALSHPATAGTFLWAFGRAGLTREEARVFITDLAVGSVQRIAAAKREGGSQ
jgi:AcrR family transcriptional regulator